MTHCIVKNICFFSAAEKKSLDVLSKMLDFVAASMAGKFPDISPTMWCQ